MELAQSSIIFQRKEVKNMKIATSFSIGLLLIGSLGTVNSALAEEVVITAQEITVVEEPELAEEIVITAQEFTVIEEPEFPQRNYCHQKFRAMSESSLAGNHPQVNPTGDIIDFYGSCDETPTGKDQVHSQKIENQHHWVTSQFVDR
jgi:hypothetical protein